MQGDSWGIYVCVDCQMWLANAETPTHLSQTDTAEWVDAVKANMAGTVVTLGADHSKCEHGPEDWEGCIRESTDSFSRSACHLCRSPLGGARYPATISEA